MCVASDKACQHELFRYTPGAVERKDEVHNFRMVSPGKDALQSTHEGIVVQNIEMNPEGVFLRDLLQQFKGKTCHFGGCSWVTSEFDKRNIVELANPDLAEKYKITEPSEEEKREARKARFNL